MIKIDIKIDNGMNRIILYFKIRVIIIKYIIYGVYDLF